MGEYASDRQRRWFHANVGKVKGITAAEVAKRDKASKGKKLPETSHKSMKLKAKVRFKKKKGK